MENIFKHSTFGLNGRHKNAFADVTITEGAVDTQTLTTDHKTINDGHAAYQVTLSPFVNGKRVCNKHGRNGEFDLIHGANDPATMGKNMTEAHSCCLALSTAACTGKNADKFRYPIGTSNEHKLTAASVRALHDKTPLPAQSETPDILSPNIVIYQN